MRKKVSIIGAGMTGSAIAQRIAEWDTVDLALVDIIEGLAQGKALDILQSGPVLGYDSFLAGSTDYEGTAGSDVVVIASGVPRKPGMSRDDLLQVNMAIVEGVTREAVSRSPSCVIVVLTNPLDAMCHVALEASCLPKERVVGQAGILDTARFRTFIAQEVDVSVEDVQAYVLGGHGDTMVPLVRYCTVAGIPLSQFLPQERIEAIVQRTRQAGGEIVSLLKTGSAFYAPSAAVAQMVESILFDKKRVLPCAAYLEGEYGVHGLFVGVPVKLGAGGVEQVIEITLDDEERAMFQHSADAVRELVEAMSRLRASAPGR